MFYRMLKTISKVYYGGRRLLQCISSKCDTNSEELNLCQRSLKHPLLPLSDLRYSICTEESTHEQVQICFPN